MLADPDSLVRQDPRPVFRNRDRVLEVRRPLSVDTDDSPAVWHRSRAGPPDVHHRLDGNREPGLQTHSALWLPVIRHLWILVESNADPVTHEIANDAETRRLDDALHRRTD